MNTHDRIELPPLPYPYDTPAYRTVGAVIQEYARAAIKADRYLRGETYNYKRIGWELERTAMGDGFYGNALRVAKDIPGVSEEDREVLDRYAAGKQQGMDHVALQNIALNIYTIPQPDTPTQSMNKEFSQFLSDVMTAAGLVSHGKQCKELGERLRKGCMNLRNNLAIPEQVQIKKEYLKCQK